jgi:hypothetical protein
MCDEGTCDACKTAAPAPAADDNQPAATPVEPTEETTEETPAE